MEVTFNKLQFRLLNIEKFSFNKKNWNPHRKNQLSNLISAKLAIFWASFFDARGKMWVGDLQVELWSWQIIIIIMKFIPLIQLISFIYINDKNYQ